MSTFENTLYLSFVSFLRAKPALNKTRFADLRTVTQTGSTNADMKLLLSSAGSVETLKDPRQVSPIVLLADHQTAGRGRLDRTWQAPPGTSLLMTIGLPLVGISDEYQSLLTTCLALSVTDATQKLGSGQVRIKWPNDLVCDAAAVSGAEEPTEATAREEEARLGYFKLGGILAELHQIPGVGACALLGLGLNVNWPEVPTELLGIASSLNKAVGHEIDREELLLQILLALDARWLPLLEEPSGDLSVLFDTYRSRSATIGSRVRVVLPQGELVGTAADIAVDGALLLRDDFGAEHVVTVGDVVHSRPTT
jgi:BirA family biotin operon repressor/biotin-[acetyl-CoA-carboxylase] ligase